MSLVKRAVRFATKIAVEAFVGHFVENASREVGTAIGNVIARRIDPKHGGEDKDGTKSEKSNEETSCET